MPVTEAPTPKDERPATSALPPVLAGVGLVAMTVLAWITRRVTTHASHSSDKQIRANVQAERTVVGDMIARPLNVLSMPGVVVPASLGVAWRLYHTDRRAAALAVTLAPAIAMTVGQSFTMFLPQRHAPDTPDSSSGAPEPSFPSGHTTGVTAEALSIAYVLTRERLTSPRTLAVLLGWPLAVGVVRLYRDRHWASDVLAGWSAGIAVAALCALIYEQRRTTYPL